MPEQLSLRGQVALVTNGGRGLGAAIALALADAGAALVPLAHESCELTAVAALVRAGGHAILGVTASDYADADAVLAAIDDARTYLGSITIFVDTVGIPAAHEAVLADMAEVGWGCIITLPNAPSPPADLPFIARLVIDPTAPPDTTAAQVRDFCLRALPSE